MKISKKFLVVLVAAAFGLLASACGTGVDAAEDNSPSSPLVIINPQSTQATAPTLPPEPEFTPEIPQAQVNTKYILTARARPPNAQGKIPLMKVDVYKSLGGELITQQEVMDPETGEIETKEVCLEDYADSCLPTDPTGWGAKLTFLVTQGEPGDEWAEVLLSTRPNNTRGWIRTTGFEWSQHEFHVVIDISEKTVSIWRGSQSIASNLDGTSEDNERTLISHALAIIGTPSRPTPIVATTYIEAKIKNIPTDKASGGWGITYGTWILPLAAYSDELTEFQGGSPQVAIHGTNLPGNVGQALSSGCIRVENSVIELMAEMLPIGTPVSIIA